MNSRSVIHVVLAVAMAFGAATLGCSDDDDSSYDVDSGDDVDSGGNSCQQAAAKMESCGSSAAGDATCETKKSRCIAACINNATCEEMADVNSSFVPCVSGCGK